MEAPDFLKGPGTKTATLVAPVVITPASYSVSKSNSLMISGSCQDGLTVELSGSGTNSVTCSASSFYFPITKTSDGTYNFKVIHTDASGEFSPTVSITWVLDTHAPLPPTVTTPAKNPMTTAGNSMTISGDCESGSLVSISGALTASTTCTDSKYSFVASKSSDANYSFQLQQTDSAGNTSASTAFAWVRDTQAPSALALTSPSSNPFLSGDTSITLSGPCEVGATVQLSGATTASSLCTSGTYSFPVSKASDGTYSFSLKQIDPAMNTSSSTSFQWTRDTSIPATPVVQSPASNPWISNTNTVTLVGPCTTGYTVSLSGDLTASDVTNPSGSLTQTCSGSSYSFTVQKTLDATYNFSLTQENSSTLSTSASASFQWTRDTVAPATPVITSPASSPSKSNLSSLTLSGACETGATVTMSGADTGSATCISSSFAFTINKSSDGTFNFSISQTDAAGNSSGSATHQWQRSTALPPAPTITTPATSPYLSNSNSLTLAGACVTGNTVELSGDSTATTTCTSSLYSFTISPTSDGTYLYAVDQKDAYGNTSAKTTMSWTRDTLAPGAPTITNPTANPLTSGDSSVTLTGACESGATVNLSGTTTASTLCSGGIYSFTLSQNVNGTYNYSVSQTDLASNISAATSFQWVRDNTIPGTPTITSPSPNPYYSNTNTIVLSGACTSTNNVVLGGDVAASDVTSPVGALTQTCNSGSYSFTIQKSSDGAYTFLVHQENPTTLITSADASLVWNRDTVTPAAPVISNPATSPYTASGNLTLSGSCETGTTVKVAGDATLSTTCTAGAFSFTVIKSIDGTYNFSVNQTDKAGNVSGSVAVQWVRDSNVTPSPVITTPNITNYASNTSSLTISGTCITGNTITISGNITAPEITSPAGALTQTCTNNSFSYTVAKTSDATYSFSFKQTSLGQGDSGPVPLNWTRDTTAPETTLSSTPSDPNLTVDAIFSFSSADTTASFECQLDSSAYASCTSPITYSSVSQGAHTFHVRAKDSVGNMDATPATYSWTQMSYKTIALYHFTSGNSFQDSSLFPSPYTNNLSDSSSTTSVAGKFTDGQNFNSASSQFLSRAHNASLAALNSTMTFEAQIKLSSLPTNGSYQVLASKSGVAGNAGWEVRIKRQGSNYFLTFHGSTDGTAVTEVKSTSFTLDTTSFHHVAVTWNKGAVKFYFDGASKGSGTIGVSGSATLFANTAALRLGRSETMNATIGYFAGVMDEVRLSQVLRWSAAFTAPTSEYAAPD